MGTATLKNLQQGLKSAAAPEPPKIEAVPTAQARPDRAGKTLIGGWFPRTYSSSLRLIQAAHPERTTQELVREALNDLFAKHNVPIIER
jgi:hypothetical protein